MEKPSAEPTKAPLEPACHPPENSPQSRKTIRSSPWPEDRRRTVSAGSPAAPATRHVPINASGGSVAALLVVGPGTLGAGEGVVPELQPPASAHAPINASAAPSPAES